MFFSGGLQEGIALAVSQSKAVICFVRDDEQTSTLWEEDYFTDNELAQSLESRSVLLRLSKDSQEAGFLTSFCPVTKFPAAVVIKHGMLREYIVPDISKDDFSRRLRAALEDSKPADEGSSAQIGQSHAATPSTDSPIVSATAPQPELVSAPVPAAAAATSPPAPAPASTPMSSESPAGESHRRPDQQRYDGLRLGNSTYRVEASRQTPKPEPKKQEGPSRKKDNSKPASSTREKRLPETKPPKASTPVESNINPAEDHKPQTPTPPKQYRLQVRLFDGSSIRSSFSPSQTISGDVRPWIDSQMVEGKRPYNLKHILTPLPNRTLTIGEEEQTLADLGLGSTANLVMVPINTYTEAYPGAGSSLPARAVTTAVSSAYGLVSSAVGTATGLVGSFLGYGQPASTPSETSAASRSSSSPATSDGAARPRPSASRGPIIRTLRDQRNEQNDTQFYNGNQPRDTDRQ
ncbi:hypothetical protein BBP40_000875 [Aspergillus hancockii]|nr:hypothetical protein BBP40_000875 [Aspergillus hancockii]